MKLIVTLSVLIFSTIGWASQERYFLAKNAKIVPIPGVLKIVLSYELPCWAQYAHVLQNEVPVTASGTDFEVVVGVLLKGDPTNGCTTFATRETPVTNLKVDESNGIFRGVRLIELTE